MTQAEKEALLTEEDLSKVTEHRFYITMSLRDRLKVRDNMEDMKKRHKGKALTMSKVLRKVMLEYMNDDEFLEYIGILEKPTGIL